MAFLACKLSHYPLNMVFFAIMAVHGELPDGTERTPVGGSVGAELERERVQPDVILHVQCQL